MHALVIELATEAQTRCLGQDLAMSLKPGDTVALSGPLGAGKSVLARAMLRALAGDPGLEVPSPTYSLCQNYEFAFPVAHYDFYRLADPSEVTELGFTEAAETGAVIVEWPERAGNHIPMDALRIEIIETGEHRQARVSGGGEGESSLADRYRRSRAARHFLDLAWEPGAERRFLQGDASARRYETIHCRDEVRILMDAPKRPDGPAIRDGKPYSRIAHLAEDIVPFIAIDTILRTKGLAAPQIHARKIADGFLLIEHLGDGRIVDPAGHPLPDRYMESARLLAWFHAQDWPPRTTVAAETGEKIEHAIARYDREALMIEASLMADWYAPRQLGRPLAVAERNEFNAVWDELAGIVEGSMPTLVLRDYHSPNLIWRPEHPFPENLGLIDFQDAVIGPQAYDLASVAQDARVDVSAALEDEMVNEYIALRKSGEGFDETTFRRDYAILAAHRATKILGIFVRLDVRDGKPGYLRHLPRMQSYLMRNLRHPILARYRAWCSTSAGFTGA